MIYSIYCLRLAPSKRAAVRGGRVVDLGRAIDTRAVDRVGDEKSSG